MPTAAVDSVAHAEEVAHLGLILGRLMLLNGADTEQVEAAVNRFVRAFGCTAQMLVSYEALLVTVVCGEHFRTKISRRVPGMGVGMAGVLALNRLLADIDGGGVDLEAARAALQAIERGPAAYPLWLVVAALGLTAASLSRLFGGDWPAFAEAGLAGAGGTWLRLELGRRGFGPIFVPFAAACVGGLIGGAGVLLGGSATPALCLVAPGMILVPGVPLINGVQDMIRNHVTLGVSRLGFAGLVTIAIALGLFVATAVTGVAIPVDAPARAVGVPEDALFSALAALGYAFLFNVPGRMAAACVMCGIASHTLRTFCVQRGLDIVGGTLIGAFAAGLLAQWFARRYRAPAAAFAFPGVVAMVPGAYAFRAVLGGLRIAHGDATPALLTETLGLAVTVVLMVGAIAVGVAAPVAWSAPAVSRH